jgi:hypothetical protein
MSNQEALDLLESYEKSVDLSPITNRAKELRDAYLEKNDLEQKLKQANENIQRIERTELPEMFTQAGISSITVEPSGNHPGFVAERSTVYTAKIPDEKRIAAFQWMEQNGHGDLVKSVININFGMQEHEERLRVMKILSDAGVQYYTNESVHHMTLKAFVKSEILRGNPIPMDLLGAYVFDEVKIK